MMILTIGSPPSGTESGDGQKNEGFLKSVWHKLMDNCDSKPEAKDTKDSKTDKNDASHKDSKKSS